MGWGGVAIKQRKEGRGGGIEEEQSRILERGGAPHIQPRPQKRRGEAAVGVELLIATCDPQFGLGPPPKWDPPPPPPGSESPLPVPGGRGGCDSAIGTEQGKPLQSYERH